MPWNVRSGVVLGRERLDGRARRGGNKREQGDPREMARSTGYATRRWKIELTLEELAAIERARALASAEKQVMMLEEHSLTVVILGERFPCKPISFRLLSYLIHRQGTWVRSEVLAREALQTSFQGGASNLRWHVFQARHALDLRGTLLHSDNRLGFMFDFALCGRRHCAGQARQAPTSLPAVRRVAGRPPQKARIDGAPRR
jgi:hypothetical protein